MHAVTTPMPRDLVAASSPLLCLKVDWSFSITSWPLIWTVLLPLVVSEAIAVFGYGIGTGPAGGVGGLKHTSGMAAIVFPSAALHAMLIPFAYTCMPIRRL